MHSRSRCTRGIADHLYYELMRKFTLDLKLVKLARDHSISWGVGETIDGRIVVHHNIRLTSEGADGRVVGRQNLLMCVRGIGAPAVEVSNQLS